MNVFLQPCADKQAQKNYQKTIISGVVWDDIKDCLEDRFFDKLSNDFKNGKIKVWGVPTSSKSASKLQMVEENDLILFGANKKFIYLGYLSCKTKNKNLAEKLWPYHENNITFDYIYFIKYGQEINIEQDLTIIKAQTGFNYSPDKRLHGCEFHEGKNADSIIEHLRKNNIFLDDKLNIKSIMDTKDKYFYKKRSEDEDFNYNSVSDPTKEDEKEFLESRSPISKENLKEELKKIEDEYKNKPPEERVKIGKILCRNPKIAYLIKERAKYNCEICGCFPFKQKNGNWYAEAHHILELSKSKIDLPSNMICVCPTCHRVIHYGMDEELEKRKKLKS